MKNLKQKEAKIFVNINGKKTPLSSLEKQYKTFADGFLFSCVYAYKPKDMFFTFNVLKGKYKLISETESLAKATNDAIKATNDFLEEKNKKLIGKEFLYSRKTKNFNVNMIVYGKNGKDTGIYLNEYRNLSKAKISNFKILREDNLCLSFYKNTHLETKLICVDVFTRRKINFDIGKGFIVIKPKNPSLNDDIMESFSFYLNGNVRKIKKFLDEIITVNNEIMRISEKIKTVPEEIFIDSPMNPKYKLNLTKY